MQFRKLATYLNKLEKTTSRIEITEILSRLFKKAEAKEIDKIVYLSLGTLAPSYKNIVFNIAERMMLQAIARAYSKDVEKVRAFYKLKGDLGNLAEELSKRKTSNLSVISLYKTLLDIAQDGGEGSQERKVSGMAKLLTDLDSLSARFVARIPVGRLRLGFSDKTILDALSWMVKGDKSVKADLEKVYRVMPDVGLLAKRVKIDGIKKATTSVQPEVGVPVMPMLAQRLKSPAEMVAKMGKVAIEPKLDGVRVLIHFKKGKNGFIRAFTRNLNDVSGMFPELEKIGKYINAKEVILDTEGIGMDVKRAQMVDFQTTMRRRRKHGISELAIQVPLKFYVFDILTHDGKNHMDRSYVDRRKILEKVVKLGGVLTLVDFELTSDPTRIAAAHKVKLKEGLEGVIVKRADSQYIPGRTGWRWVKMKEVEKASGKLADTIDCIVMGYYSGKGRRTSFGIGGFLVGVSAGDEIKTITKVGTGLTDEQFKELKKRLSKLEVKKAPPQYEVHKNLEPDVWVSPGLVVEIAADNITKSPTHTGGLALRFPRLVRFRDDKSPAQATTLKEVKSMV